jgi:hypothetical protein
VIVVAGAAGAWAYTRPRVEGASSATLVAVSPERSTLDRAKKLSAGGDLEGAHKLLATISEGSPLRSTTEFREVENRWADDLLERADAEGDLAAKRALYQRVAQAMTVEPTRRKAGADKLQELDVVANTAINRMQVAAASTVSVSGDAAAVTIGRPDPGRRTFMATEALSPPTVFVPPPAPPPTTLPVTTSQRGPGGSVDDRERQLALQGTQDSKILLKQQLEQRVYSGKATDTEIRLLISTCKDLGDKPCVQEARAIQAQRGL